MARKIYLSANWTAHTIKPDTILFHLILYVYLNPFCYLYYAPLRIKAEPRSLRRDQPLRSSVQNKTPNILDTTYQQLIIRLSLTYSSLDSSADSRTAPELGALIISLLAV